MSCPRDEFSGDGQRRTKLQTQQIKCVCLSSADVQLAGVVPIAVFPLHGAAAPRVSQKHHQPWITSPEEMFKRACPHPSWHATPSKKEEAIKAAFLQENPAVLCGEKTFPTWCVQVAQSKSRFYVFVLSVKKINYGWVVKCYGVIVFSALLLTLFNSRQNSMPTVFTTI